MSGDEASQQVPARYRFLHGGADSAAEHTRLMAALPYDRIELCEVSSWTFGGQTLTLQRNGLARLEDGSAKTGKVRDADFGRLCELAESIRFEALARHYEWNVTHATTYTVRVWPSGARDPIEVEDYGGVGPVELWGLRAAIEGVARRIEWK